MSTLEEDLAVLRRMWQQRQDAAEPMRRRIDTRGMTRPPRAPEERAWLEEHGGAGPFVEVPPEAAEPAGPGPRSDE
jgi:hypothetical protein